MIHAGFTDSAELAERFDDQQQQLGCCRRIRDEIKEFVQGMPENLE